MLISTRQMDAKHREDVQRVLSAPDISKQVRHSDGLAVERSQESIGKT